MVYDNTRMITLWDALMHGQKNFNYQDVVEVYVCLSKGARKVKILETSPKGVLVKMPPLQKGKIYGVKIVTAAGWNKP